MSYNKYKFLIIGTTEIESFSNHISENLIQMGHDVIQYNPSIKLKKGHSKIIVYYNKILFTCFSFFNNFRKYRELRFRSLSKILKVKSFDIILFTHDFFWPYEINKLKQQTNSKIVMWFPDHIVNTGKCYFMNSDYDYLFFKDPYIIKIFNNILKSKIYYLPECFNPYKHKADGFNSIPNEFLCDITTAGNSHSWRVAFFENLKNYNIKFWGNPNPVWMENNFLNTRYQGKAVFNNEKASAFLGSKIVLNNLHFGEIYGLNARAFETAGIGAFQLVDWRPGINDLFEIDKEIICFNGIIDLKKKIDFWLNNTEGRITISNAAKIRAYKDHTYENRLKLMINTIFENDHGYKIPLELQ